MYIKRKKIHAIMESLKAGSAMYNACKAADLHISTLWLWRKANPRLDRIIKSVMDSRIQMVEDALYKGAIDGNTTAQIFYLKNRGDWHDTPLIDQSRHQTVIIKWGEEESDNNNSLPTDRVTENIT